MNLWSYYHFDMFYIKNETNNDARILEGIIQTHHFFFHFYHKDTICKKSKLCFLYNTMTYYDLLLLYFRIYLLHFFVYIFHGCYVLKFYGFEKDDNFKPNLLHQKWFHSIKQVIVNSISIICFYFLTNISFLRFFYFVLPLTSFTLLLRFTFLLRFTLSHLEFFFCFCYTSFLPFCVFNNFMKSLFVKFLI